MKLLTLPLLAACSAVGLAAGGSVWAAELEYNLALAQPVPVRDGVKLGASLYLPENGGRPVPTLFTMTPYGVDSFHPEAAALARRGFAVALVDVRGRGNSEGVFEPWANDGRDGHDVAEWLARQPWSNGRVGMFGHSFGGRAVWSTLKERPPHLKAAAPLAPSLPMLGWKNILTPDTMQWIALLSGRGLNSRVSADEAFWVNKFRRLYLEMRPLAELDRLVGDPSALFQRFLAHSTSDDYWTAVTPDAADFARIDVPVLTVVGQYDNGVSAALWYYRQHLAARGSAARHQLLLGPWDHRGALRPSTEAGGLQLGEAARIDLIDELAGWFGAQLGGQPLVGERAAPVRWYELGANQWHQATSLAEVEAEVVSLYLDSDGGAGSLTRPGALRPARRGQASEDGWLYDPRDLRPGAAERSEPVDWASHLGMPEDLWGSGVAYTTEPFGADTRLAGAPTLVAWLAIDTPDADFAARLDLVTAEGTVIKLGEDWLRARFRKSLQREELVAAGVALEYRFELPFHVRQLPSGSRLRLILFSPNSIFMAKNFNGGGVVALESGKDARQVRVRVLHDAEHPSRLEIGLVHLAKEGSVP